MNFLERKKEAEKWAMKNLRNKKVYCPILEDYLEIRRSGIKHTLNYKLHDLKIFVIYRIVDYLKRAKKAEISYKDNKSAFKLSLNATINKDRYKVYMIIKEDDKGKYYMVVL